MKRVKGSAETDIRVKNNGTVVLPVSFLRELNANPGSKVRIRVTSGSLSRDLLTRGVTEEEIELIGAIQFEPRANVVAFLSSEGALSADDGFLRKSRRVGR